MSNRGPLPRDTSARSPHASFAPPAGFTATQNPPIQGTDEILTSFVFSDGDHEPRGYIVVKRQRSVSGEAFWEVCRYAELRDGHCAQIECHAVASAPDARARIEQAADRIR